MLPLVTTSFSCLQALTSVVRSRIFREQSTYSHYLQKNRSLSLFCLFWSVLFSRKKLNHLNLKNIVLNIPRYISLTVVFFFLFSDLNKYFRVLKIGVLAAYSEAMNSLLIIIIIIIINNNNNSNSNNINNNNNNNNNKCQKKRTFKLPVF